MQFSIHSTSGNARTGTVVTAHGEFATPAFMPVGTQATVKSVMPDQVFETGARIILSNAYHLYLRPGPDVVAQAGGLHKFMNWKGSILTDSGGFQVMSLGHLVELSDQGAAFRSHIDGRLIRFTPEESVGAQVKLGADIIMCFDQCIRYPAEYPAAKEAVRRTTLWARRAKDVPIPPEQALFGIVQGATYPELRRISAEALVDLDFPGYAIGGLSVGESKSEFYDTLRLTCEHLPKDKPRYLMGVGHPMDLVEGAAAGVDMFDCVLPTRNARHGRAFTFLGPINLRNARYALDGSPIEEGCDCPACRGFSRSYIRHLLVSEESLAWTLLTIHNLRFFQRLMEKIRVAIRQGNLEELRSQVAAIYPV